MGAQATAQAAQHSHYSLAQATFLYAEYRLNIRRRFLNPFIDALLNA